MGISRRTLYNMIADGRVKARKDFNGKNYIPKKEVERLLGEIKIRGGENEKHNNGKTTRKESNQV